MSYSAFVPHCVICTQAVNLTESKTDEDGQAVHEDCYVSNLIPKKISARADSDYSSFTRTAQKPFLVRRSHHLDQDPPTPQRANGGFWY